MTHLSDLGERQLIREVLQSRYGKSNPQFGDDGAIAARLADTAIVMTIDPAPAPVAWELGMGDFYDWGWLLSAINLSDRAACGALRVSMVTSLTLPSSTDLNDFIKLLDGIDDCNEANQCVVVGGN